jgi:adenylate cyclase
MVVSLNTFLFADLCDYTERTFRNGDEFAAELAVGFHFVVSELAASEFCEVIKSTGDAVMVRAAMADDAVRLAQRIQCGGELLGYPLVRVGIDTGPAVPRAGDWYGTTVNRAARVAEAAGPGEMLLTEGALASIAISDALEIVERGLFALKGLPHSRLYTARFREPKVSGGRRRRGRVVRGKQSAMSISEPANAGS